MQVCVIGGFSSFAKRAIIESRLSSASEIGKGRKVTILLNGDSDFITGTRLVDDLDAQIELFDEGCFCCTLRDALTETLIEQRDGRKPSLILMSASVIADLGQVGALIKRILGEETDVLSIFSLDLESAAPIIDSFIEMVERNVKSADAVMLMDGADSSSNESRAVISRLRGMNPGLVSERIIDVRGKRSIVLAVQSRDLQDIC